IARDTQAAQSVSADRSFTVNVANDAPSAPGLTSPSDGQTISSLNPTFSWSASSDADPGDSVTYEVRSSTDASFGVYTASGGVTALQWTVSASLAAGSTYYWKVLAHDSNGASTASAS